MNEYIGYIRVSTQKQGTKGVSLVEQREAISLYAQRNHLVVSLWLEETETAAKQGRPIFNEALKLLQRGKARGIILHKLDRGARNLRDWIAIGDLADQGIEVHFVNESLDLNSRGGRLSADIQAVVSADYIRNLKEETRKGFYGRLKQGWYPLRAPTGYVDNGKAKPKTIDPIMGPLARKAFELYGTALYNFDNLTEKLYQLGLRNRNGRRVTRTGLSTMLNNPFYIGLMRIHKTKEVFKGNHEPLISKSLFDRVQAVLTGRINTQIQRHDFLFRRMLKCSTCKYSLNGERQKGHIYYRCHTKTCPPTSIRQEVVESKVEELLRSISFDTEEKQYFEDQLLSMRKTWKSHREEEEKSLNLRLAQINDRMNRLTDAYIDQALDKPAFEQRKKALLLEQKAIGENLSVLRQNLGQTADRIEKFLELAGSAYLSHQMANPEEKREMIQIFTSNFWVTKKSVVVEPSIPFSEIIKKGLSANFTFCGPKRDVPRTWDPILAQLITLDMNGLLPDLNSTPIRKNYRDI